MFLSRNFKTLHKYLRLNPIVREQTLTTSLTYLLLQDTLCIIKKELINKENTIKNLSIILKNITSNTYKVSPSNKESGNEPILEDNTDHGNEIDFQFEKCDSP